MRRGGMPVPVEVGLDRGQRDQLGGAGESGAYSSGEFGGAFGLPSTRHMGFKNQAGSKIVGLKSIYIPGPQTLGTTPTQQAFLQLLYRNRQSTFP